MQKGKIRTRAQIKLINSNKKILSSEPLKKSKKTMAIKKTKKIQNRRKNKKIFKNVLTNQSLNKINEKTHTLAYNPQTNRFAKIEDYKVNPE